MLLKVKTIKKEQINNSKYWIWKSIKKYFVLIFKISLQTNHHHYQFDYCLRQRYPLFFLKSHHSELTLDLLQLCSIFQKNIESWSYPLVGKHSQWTQFIMACLFGELSLKLWLLFTSFPASVTSLMTWSSQHTFRIDLKGLIKHTLKGCTLNVHPAGTFTTLVWPFNNAATWSLKWALNVSITIKNLWILISFALSRTYLSHIFSYHNVIKCSSIQVFFWVTLLRLSGTVRSSLVGQFY